MKEQLNKARGLAVAGITAMVFCFTSCGVEVGNPGSVTLVTRPPASVSGYQIVDAANRRVRIPGDITSIVTTDFSTSSLLIASGQTGCLSGFDAVFAESFLAREMGAPLADLPVVTNEEGLDVDAILRIDPDLVLLASRYQDRLPELERAGLNVVVADADTLDGFSQVSTYGIFLDRSRPLARDTVDVVFSVEAVLKKADTVSVYLAGAEDYWQPADRGLMTELVEIAGGRSAAEGREGQPVTPEQLLEWDPDFILLPGGAAYTEEDILADERLAGLYAVRNNRILTLPEALEAADSYSMLVGMQVQWLAMQLHPEFFEKQAVCEEILDFYQKRYGISLTMEDLEG